MAQVVQNGKNWCPKSRCLKKKELSQMSFKSLILESHVTNPAFILKWDDHVGSYQGLWRGMY